MKITASNIVLVLLIVISENSVAVEIPAIPSKGSVANVNSASYYDKARKLMSKAWLGLQR